MTAPRSRAGWAALLIALAACTTHPVGPARTFDAYEGKAVTTAEAALSAAETVRLAAETAGLGHAFGPYLSVLISGQEDVDGRAGNVRADPASR